MRNHIIAFGLTYLSMILVAIVEIIINALIGNPLFDDIQYAIGLSVLAIYSNIADQVESKFRKQ